MLLAKDKTFSCRYVYLNKKDCTPLPAVQEGLQMLFTSLALIVKLPSLAEEHNISNLHGDMLILLEHPCGKLLLYDSCAYCIAMSNDEETIHFSIEEEDGVFQCPFF